MVRTTFRHDAPAAFEPDINDEPENDATRGMDLNLVLARCSWAGHWTDEPPFAAYRHITIPHTLFLT